jgi:formate hydrogenlyase subunit 3/multisubunit Na+/H+ antiporter MnhD subunit
VNLLLWLAPLLLPLVFVVPVTARPGPRTSWLLVAAPAPALAVALIGEALPPPALPWLLLDVRLGADGISRILLLLTAIVWAIAGVYGRAFAEERGGFAALWLLSLVGNVGLLLAADAITFYASFVVMTLAAYGLVVQSRSAQARRAGRVYLVLGVAGEVLLLAGLLLAATAAAGGLLLDELSTAIAASPRRDLIVVLLFVGFGLKAGVIGLHVWLPLAHPAAPFPASAVLSGAMIKAGLVGWVRFLPVGELGLPVWSSVVIGLGLATAFAGVLIGLVQRDPKVVLAYSSISQMGFITVLVGVALGVPGAAPVATAAAAVYALHHGLAKAVLFLGAGLLGQAHASTRRRLLVAGMALAALSLAGLPATSGAFAKTWAKQAVDTAAGGEGVGLALSVAAVGTTLLMARLFAVLPTPVPSPAAGRPERLAPWAMSVGAVAVLTVAVPARLFSELDGPALTLVAVRETLWPVLAGVLVARAALVASRSRPLPMPIVPPGDLVVIGEWTVARLGAALRAAAGWAGPELQRTGDRLRGAASELGRRDQGLDRVEEWLTRWRTGGALIALAVVAVLQALRRDVS